MQNKKTVKYAQRLLAFALFSASVFYLVEAVRRNQQSINLDIFASILPEISIATLLWTIALFALALGWARLMLWDSEQGYDDLVYIYGLTNIAKYLPGNIFHFAARQAAARTMDIPQKTAATATSVEIVSLIVAAMLIGVVSLALFAEPTIIADSLASLFDSTDHTLALIGLVVAAILIGAVISRSQTVREFTKQLSKKLTAHLAYSILFFSIVSLAAVLLAMALNVSFKQSLVIAGAFQVAWAIGFVLPGASAGLGVREAAFILVMGLVASQPESLAIQLALIMRVMNIFGDVANAGICFLLRAKKASDNAN